MPDPNTVYQMASAVYLCNRANLVTGRVLDVGCGRKPYKRLFPESEWVGLDIRPVGDITADAHKMPFEDESFDSVICTDVLHMTPTPFAVIGECARVLKPSGHLIVTARCTGAVDGETLSTIHPVGLGQMLVGAGLKGVDLRPEGFLISNEWRDLTGFDKFAFPLPSEVGGWCNLMDQRYPALSCGVAQK